MSKFPQEEKTNIVLENILNRKSVRHYLEGKKIPDAKIQTLLKAGMAAPSARNIQPWEFIIVDDRDILDKLAERNTYGKMLFSASHAIIVAGNTDKMGEHKDFWQQDAAAATQNIMLMAESMGLGSVWIGVYPKEDRIQIAKDELNLPDNIIPFNIISLGYPDGTDKPKDKWNENNIHYNGF